MADSSVGSPEARELDRLVRFLTRPGPRFGLGLAIVRDPVVGRELRERLAAEVEAAGRSVARVTFGYEDEREDLVQRMIDAGQGADALLVDGLERLLIDVAGNTRETPALANLNQRRDALPGLLDLRVVFWVTRDAYRSLSEQAWDLRQIMLTVAEFERVAKVRGELAGSARARVAGLPQWFQFVDERAAPIVLAQAEGLARAAEEAEDPRTVADAAASAAQAYIAAARFDEALAWLERAAELVEELGELLEASIIWQLRTVVNAHLGRLTQAQLDSERGVELARRGGSEVEQAAALDSVVFVLGMKGEPAEALRVLLEQVVPLYERAGDRVSAALNRARAAELLGMQGEDEEALRLLHKEALPVIDRLGTASQRASVLGAMADIHHYRGELDEALRIWRDEVLPIHQREKDIGAKAATFDKIATILELRAELEEALRVRVDHELPLYGHSRDVRKRLGTLTWVAALRRKLGEFDAAIDLLEQQVLPELERLGMGIEHASAQWTLASALVERGQRADLSRALHLLEHELADVENPGVSSSEANRRALAEWIRAQLAE